VSRFYENFISQSGLTTAQYMLLSCLKLYGPLTMRALSRASRLERTTLVRKLKPLQKEGFARVCKGDAGKANEVALTDEGRKILETAEPLWKRAQESFKARLDGDEREYLTRIVSKLSQINEPDCAREDEAKPR
jgi:DNA-binding MarR family transcriptional regulator